MRHTFPSFITPCFIQSTVAPKALPATDHKAFHIFQWKKYDFCTNRIMQFDIETSTPVTSE